MPDIRKPGKIGHTTERVGLREFSFKSIRPRIHLARIRGHVSAFTIRAFPAKSTVPLTALPSTTPVPMAWDPEETSRSGVLRLRN